MSELEFHSPVAAISCRAELKKATHAETIRPLAGDQQDATIGCSQAISVMDTTSHFEGNLLCGRWP